MVGSASHKRGSFAPRGAPLPHKMLWFFLLLSASHALSEAGKSRPVPPVILVPGDGGSQMEAMLDKPEVVHYMCLKKTDYWYDLWLNMELLIPEIIDCWIDNMRLVYDNKTRTTKNSPGVQTRIPGFGTTNTVEWLDPSHRYPTSYFIYLVEAMVKSQLGYKRNVTVRGAPFDFRKAPNEQQVYFEALRNLTEEMYSVSGQRVVFLLHSMGGPVLWYFLAHQPQHWKDKYVEAVISLAGAWGGSIKAVKVYTSGDNLGFYLINPQNVRKEQRSSSSLAFLMPSRDVWKADEVIVQTPEKNYSTANFEDMFEALHLPDAYNMYLDTKDLLRGLPPPGVELYCLYGVAVDTVEKLIYTEGKFPDTPEIVFGDGDGTVNTRSSQVCESFKEKQKQKVHLKAFPRMEHMAILKTNVSILYVMDVLLNITERNEKAAAAAASASAATNIIIEGNEEVHVNIIQRDDEFASTAAKTALRTEEAIHAAAAAAKAALRNEVATDPTLKKSIVAKFTYLEALEKAREDNMVEKYFVRHLHDYNRIKRSRVSSSNFWKVLNGQPKEL